MKILLIFTLIQGIFQTSTSNALPILLPCHVTNTCIPITEYEAVLTFKNSYTRQRTSRRASGWSFASCQSNRRDVITDMSSGHFVPGNSGQPPLIWWWIPVNTPNCSLISR
jgi:hypothetical protein